MTSRSRLPALAPALLAGLLVAGLLVAACATTAPTVAPTPTPPPPTDAAPTPTPRPAAEVYAEIRAQVIALRGLQPAGAVDPVTIDEAQLRMNLEEGFEKENKPQDVADAEDL